MSDEEQPEPVSVTELLLDRVKFGPKDIAFLSFVGFTAIILSGIVRGLLRPVFAPYSTAVQIDTWLKTSDYVADYERNVSRDGTYRFDVELEGSDTEPTVHMVRRGGPIRIVATEEISPDKLLMLLERDRNRRQLQTQIEAVLANVRGSYSYLDANGESCSIEEMRKIGLEYRIYPDGLTQHEFMNALLDIERAVTYVNQRVDKLAEGLEGDR
jgi:hypothetical protein